MRTSFLSLIATAALLIGCGNRSVEIQRPHQRAIAPLKITLLGITSISGNKRALLKVESPGTSPGIPRAQSLLLSEHEKGGSIEVLDIDEKAGNVRVNNSGLVTLVTFPETAAR